MEVQLTEFPTLYRIVSSPWFDIAVPGIFSTNCHIFREIGKLFVYGKGNKNSGCRAGRFFEPGTDSTKCHIIGGSVVGMREVFLFFVFFGLSDILNNEQLGLGQIAYYLKLNTLDAYIFYKMISA
jgi:hypothetical protein